MQFALRALVVTCDSCGKSAETWDFRHPDQALICECCPAAHDHAGLGCRTVTITASAQLTIFDINELLEAAGGDVALPDIAEEVNSIGNV